MNVMGVRNRKVRIPRAKRVGKRVRREQDEGGKIANELMEFCNDLGFDVVETWATWSQLSLEREYWLGVPQDAAEEAAWRDLKQALDKRGSEPS